MFDKGVYGGGHDLNNVPLYIGFDDCFHMTVDSLHSSRPFA